MIIGALSMLARVFGKEGRFGILGVEKMKTMLLSTCEDPTVNIELLESRYFSINNYSIFKSKLLPPTYKEDNSHILLLIPFLYCTMSVVY